MSSHPPRMHVRLRYPPGSRPRLILDAGSRDVLDLSERGLRFRQDSGPVPRIGATLEGILQLSRGETLPVRGTVVRVTPQSGAGSDGPVEVAAFLSDIGIPRRVMVAERQVIEAQQGRH